jgi:acetolactate synthase-1/2/3 large subunit
MNGAQILTRALEAEGVDIVFGYPGGAIMPVYDALLESKLKHILVRHEQGAALAADGYARSSGRVGVCMATSGPGATNLITGIGNAFADSVPMVAITGQVHSFNMGTDAFQEVDIFGISMPIVKHSFIIRNVKDVGPTIHKAFEIARSGRPGPVLIDLPKDIATDIYDGYQPQEPVKGTLPRVDAKHLAQAKEMIASAKKPLIYAGGGVRIAQATEQLLAFVEATGIPTVATLQGLGAIPATHPQFLGMLGMHGTKAANLAVQDCDLLIAVGARFDDRVTGKLADFAPGARVVHMDADPAEVSKLREADCSLVGDIRTTMNFLHVAPECKEWVDLCQKNKKEFEWKYDAPIDSIYAPKFLRKLSDEMSGDTIISCDVGQHQMWVAQHYQFENPECHLSSGAFGTMGYGLPAGIGAKLANPDSPVVVVSGDGSIMMNIQELATIRRYNIPVKIVLIDNEVLGMVRQWQELFFNERYSEVSLWDNPDFIKLADAFNIPGIYIDKDEQIDDAIQKIKNTPGPLFVHVKIDQKANVWPLVPPGKSNSQMMEASAK